MCRGLNRASGGTWQKESCSAPALSPTFVDCGAHNLVFASVFARLLRPDSKGAADLLAKRLRRFGGDTAVLGKGELFFPA